MQKVLAFLACGVFACWLVPLGCSDKDPEGTADAGGTPPVDYDASEPVASQCKDVSPVHPTANCDLCVRARCCDEVLACDKVKDCKDLRACLAPCKQGDFNCSDACRVQHDEGARLLSGVDHCASLSCPVPCGGAIITPDGG